MKILVVCQHYYPEPFRIADICEWLVKEGHEVQVITGVPNYPMGKVYDGYKAKDKRDEVINGVKVHRCFTIARRSGAVFRLLNYYSFALSSARYAKRMKEEFDVVFVNQLSPVMMANAAVKYKKKHGTKLVMYTLDLWPESLTAGGIKKSSFIFKHFHKVSKKMYSAADVILTSSKSFENYFKTEFDIEVTDHVPQYAEALFTPEACKKEPDGNIDLMFAGNVGAAQSIDTIIKAAALTKDIENLRWHIVGEGSELENMKRLAEELNASSVIFHGRKPLEEMAKYYSMADAMLVTMKDSPIISYTLPGKVQTYMAAGKPIIGAINGETQNLIDEAKCGICVPAEDAEALADAVRRFCENKSREEYAINSFAYSQANFDKETVCKRLLSHFD